MLKSFIRGLRLPWLFLLSALAMLVSWLVPDPIPMLDELLLLLLTTMLASLRKPRQANESAAGKDDQVRGADD